MVLMLRPARHCLDRRGLVSSTLKGRGDVTLDEPAPSTLTRCYDLAFKFLGEPPANMRQILDGLEWLHELSRDECPLPAAVDQFLATLRQVQEDPKMPDIFRTAPARQA
jgi:hypothetical protein